MGFIVPAIAGAGASLFAGATSSAGLAALGGVGAGLAASKAMSGAKGGGMQSPMPLPQAPSAADAIAKGDAMAARKRAATTKSIYTSPLGVSGEAQVARKTLLGQ